MPPRTAAQHERKHCGIVPVKAVQHRLRRAAESERHQCADARADPDHHTQLAKHHALHRTTVAVSPDIRRFLMIRATESNRLDNLVAVENFFEVLRAKVPRR